MKKLSNSQNLVKILASVHPRQKEMLERLIEHKGFVSISDAIRQAIVFFHDKQFPDYVYRETPAGTQKRTKAEEEAAWNAISDEEFATKTLGAPIYDSKSGRKFIFVHTLGDSIMPLPLDGIKDYLTQRARNILDLHMSILKKTPVLEKMNYLIRRNMRHDHEMIFPEDAEEVAPEKEA